MYATGYSPPPWRTGYSPPPWQQTLEMTRPDQDNGQWSIEPTMPLGFPASGNGFSYPVPAQAFGYQDPFSVSGPDLGPATAYDVYKAAIPELERQRDRNISEAMAAAGMGRTRFGTGSEYTAAQIGADTALSQNRLLTDLLYQQGEADRQRALQAASLGLQQGQALDEMMRNRWRDLFAVGQWEQGRADQLQMAPYNDWMQSRLGYLPMLLGGTTGTTPQPAPPNQTQTSAQPGFMDYLMTIAPYFLALI